MAFSARSCRVVIAAIAANMEHTTGQKRINDLQGVSRETALEVEQFVGEAPESAAVDCRGNIPGKWDKNNRSSTSTKSTATLPPDAGRNSPAAALTQPRTNINIMLSL
ncbi:hypothetical protein NP493_107g07015 [Ridgeia piscesae]|uniref:Uncharacterized protein n=1 Tax=Ridgeia piscesae TaxID=27915 RepID=A0AAD9P786_RIDPI|nr:hypothetical protein NP493_107g07015 [Ridgeia piscesae]